MQTFQIALLLILFSGSAPAGVVTNDSNSPQFVDYSQYQNFLCQINPSTHAPQPLISPTLNLADFWQQNLFSANIYYNLFSAPTKDFKLNELQQKAFLDAKQRAHDGYSFGVCPSPLNNPSTLRFWSLSSPAPMLFNDKTFAKDLRTVAVKFCRGVKISLSQLDTDSTEEIRLDDLQTLNLEKKKTSTPSTMAIYCLPLDLRYGPWLWALVPQGDPKILLANLEKTMPLQNVLDRNALLTWINEQRQERKLAKLNLLEGDLIAAISAADHPQGVAHQRSALGEMRKIIERRGFRFFGENRVQARDLKEALSRMWLSPSHRDLLLNPELSHLVIMIEKRPEIENMSQILILAAKQRGKLNQWLITPPKSLHKRGASDDKKPDSP